MTIYQFLQCQLYMLPYEESANFHKDSGKIFNDSEVGNVLQFKKISGI